MIILSVACHVDGARQSVAAAETQSCLVAACGGYEVRFSIDRGLGMGFRK